MTQVLGVEVDCPFTPGVLRTVVRAGCRSVSFDAASEELEGLAKLDVSAGRVER